MSQTFQVDYVNESCLDAAFRSNSPRRQQNRRPRVCGLLFAAAIFCSGCVTTTATINQAQEFAQAGITFTDSLGSVLDQSLEAKVRANSMTLEVGREQLMELSCSAGDTDCVKQAAKQAAETCCAPGDSECVDDYLQDPCTTDAQCREDSLQCSLERQTTKESERVELYRRFRAHAKVLRNYFQTLSSLATSEEPEALGESAQRLVAQASSLRQQITENPEASIDVGNVPSILASQVANTFRAKALQDVLKETAPAMSIELELQEKLLDQLADQTSSDLELAFQKDDDEKINDPFVASTKPLPADWADKRLAAARRGLDLTAVGAARNAAGSLRTAFEALVANRLDKVGLAGLITDLNNLATLVLEVDRVRNQPEDGGES